MICSYIKLRENPQYFPDFIPRLGGMDFLMNFVGAIGNLMENSGLELILNSTSVGYLKC